MALQHVFNVVNHVPKYTQTKTTKLIQGIKLSIGNVTRIQLEITLFEMHFVDLKRYDIQLNFPIILR